MELEKYDVTNERGDRDPSPNISFYENDAEF